MFPIYLHQKLYKNADIANFMYYGKTRVRVNWWNRNRRSHESSIYENKLVSYSTRIFKTVLLTYFCDGYWRFLVSRTKSALRCICKWRWFRDVFGTFMIISRPTRSCSDWLILLTTSYDVTSQDLRWRQDVLFIKSYSYGNIEAN